MPTVSMLASVADLDASQAAGAISQLLPSGIILPYGGATAPTGWLFCNGASYSRTTYANLFAAIGTAHGTVDGNSFNVPDLRGRFIRGTDTMGTAAGRDPDKATRTAANAGGNAGDSVGSVQTGNTANTNLGGTAAGQTLSTATVTADQGWYGFYDDVVPNVGNTYGVALAASTSPPHWRGDFATYNHNHTIAHTHGTSALTVTGGTETRPINANVNYIIKV